MTALTTSTPSIPPDQEQRDLALDPELNLIVRAPAGSGKTTLLVQRFLRLLTRVDNPETILAITFTRKAAAEMRHRVITALRDGDSEAAINAREADARGGWGLLENPSRLKIQTIDSFAKILAQSLPLHSQYLREAEIVENQEAVYQLAVDELFDTVYEDSAQSIAVLNLFALLDNKITRASNQLVAMLGQRDLWAGPILDYARHRLTDSQAAQHELVEAVEVLRDSILAQVERGLHPGFVQALFAALPHTQPPAGSPALDETADRTRQWQQIAYVMLTAKGVLRKRIETKAVPDKEHRTQLRDLAVEIGEAGQADLLELLQHLPWAAAASANASTTNRGTVDANLVTIANVLVYALSALDSVFRRENLTDFNELLIAASRALGDESGPTDFALALDYRINHLLIDEFQDTSYSQFALFEQLLAGWDASATDRSFFAVGDPQQSIYKFRGAEVGLFLRTWDQGIADLELTPVALTANFRSDTPLVNFANDAFASIFGQRTDANLGRVEHSPAQAQRGLNHAETAVTYCEREDAVTQAHAIAEHVHHLHSQFPDDSIAILVRGRPHLGPILPLLRERGLHWQAQETEALSSIAAVNDLKILHQTLFEPANRLAWFALLRSPLVGLTLTELHQLSLALLAHEAVAPDEVEASGRHTLIEHYPAATQLLLDRQRQADGNNLEDSWQRLQSVLTPLAYWSTQAYEVAPREVLENLWLALAGPAFYHHQRLQAAQFFELLDDLGEAARSPALVKARTENLYASAIGSARIAVMTIHKAKGLEFDHVLVPSVQGKGQSPKTPLLRWRPSDAGLLIADESSPLAPWLKFEDRARESAELDRLLYVASTRAKKSLGFFAVRTTEADDAPKRADPNSLLARLLPAVETLPEPDCLANVRSSVDSNTTTANHAASRKTNSLSPHQETQPPLWSRASLDEILSARNQIETTAAALRAKVRNPKTTRVQSTDTPVANPVFTAAGSAIDPDEDDQQPTRAEALASLRGTLIHEALQDLTEQNRWAELDDYLPNFRRYCLQRYATLRADPVTDIAEMVTATANSTAQTNGETLWQAVSDQLHQVANDEAHAWIFANNSTGSCEVPLSGALAGAPLQDTEDENAPPSATPAFVNAIIDRMLVDSDGVRWVIDYKSAIPTNTDHDTFVTRELQLHELQLRRYQSLTSRYFREPVRAALYFTSVGIFAPLDPEVEFGNTPT